MRYVEEKNLAFIHVPKNAGQSIANALARSAPLSYALMAADLGVTEAAMEASMEIAVDVPGLGVVQPDHLPLVFIREHFPRTWSALTAANSFILTRAPRDRFLSALMQRLREHGGTVAIRVDDPQVAEEAQRVCDWLDGRGAFFEREFIHFTRQIDYAEVSGARIVTAIFPVDGADAVAAWIQRETGLALDVTHDHRRREPRAWARAIQPAARFVGRRLIPRTVKKAIYPLWMNSGAFADAAKRYDAVHLGDDVERFITDHYAADAALHAEAQAFAARIRRPAEPAVSA